MQAALRGQGEARPGGGAGAEDDERPHAHRVQARGGAHRGPGARAGGRVKAPAAPRAATAARAAEATTAGKPAAARPASAGARRMTDGPHRGHRHRVVPGRAPAARAWPETRGADGVVAVDVAAAAGRAAACATASWTSREPASDQRLLDVLREEEVDTVVHAAFFTNPRRDTTLRARAGVDRHPEPPGRGGRGGRRGTSCCARSPPSTARAARTPTS